MDKKYRLPAKEAWINYQRAVDRWRAAVKRGAPRDELREIGEYCKKQWSAFQTAFKHDFAVALDMGAVALMGRPV